MRSLKNKTHCSAPARSRCWYRSIRPLPLLAIDATRRGFSLIELLIVIALVGILSSIAISSMTPSVHDELQGVADVVAAELSYGRSLAMANNSRYRFDFDVPGNRLVLRHSGIDAALNALPPSPFRATTEIVTEQSLRLAELPSLGMGTRLLGAQTLAGTTATTTFVEFGPYGETTRSQPTLVWLTAGTGEAQRFISISINPVTGLATVGEFTGSGPPGFLNR